MEKRILIIEDEERMRRLYELVLAEQGYLVETAGDGVEGMALWQSMQPDVVLTDLKIPKADGLEVLDFRNHQFQQIPLIILTAYGTVLSAVTAMKQGAYDYLTKPIDNKQLIEIVARAIKDTENQKGVSQICKIKPGQMIGSSPAMRKIHEDIDLVGSTRISVLITGESGTGKELVARAIHGHSDRPASPFTRVNCAAIPRDLLESELFGHLRGSFTGAVSNRKGAFVLADGGTLFLDEIGDLPLELQPKLLHAVEEKIISPVGSSKTQAVDVKIIAATNRNLDEMVLSGLFRSDLYYRLNTFHLLLPSLKERRNDLIELVDYYLDQFCCEQGRGELSFSKEALELMNQYAWPGNIRELRNVLERIVLTCRKNIITTEMLPEKIQSQASMKELNDADSFDLPAQERHLILSALEQCSWNQSESARKLGISRNTLRYRMKKYTIKRVK